MRRFLLVSAFIFLFIPAVAWGCSTDNDCASSGSGLLACYNGACVTIDSNYNNVSCTPGDSSGCGAGDACDANGVCVIPGSVTSNFTTNYVGCSCTVSVSYGVGNTVGQQRGNTGSATDNAVYDWNGNVLSVGQFKNVQAPYRSEVISEVEKLGRKAVQYMTSTCPADNEVSTPNCLDGDCAGGALSSCVPAKAVKSCCCYQLSQNSFNTEYGCQIVDDYSGNNLDCNALTNHAPGTPYFKNPTPPQGVAWTPNDTNDNDCDGQTYFIPIPFTPTNTGAIALSQLEAQAQNQLNPGNFEFPEDILGRVIRALFLFIGSIFLLMYVYAGTLWMAARGNDEMVGKARTILLWTTLGAVVMLSSYLIISFIFTTLGRGFPPF